MISHDIRRVVLIEWEDAVRISNERCIPLAREIDKHRCHRESVGWLIWADQAVLVCVVDTDVPPKNEGAWEIYPRGMIKKVTQVSTGETLEWSDVMDLACPD